MAPNSAMKVPVFPILLPPLIPSDKPPWGEEGGGGDVSNKVQKKKKEAKNKTKNKTRISQMRQNVKGNSLQTKKKKGNVPKL